MLTAAYLAVTRAAEHAREAEKGDPQPAGAH
ncbi:Mobile element protein [Pseudonocardia sp. Ae505_Ps2]|nr:Mobile element protein [Pseudonocardia sp. Ae505_Ps2]